MDRNALTDQAAELRAAIRRDWRSATATLLEFAETNAFTPQLKHEALLLRLNQFDPPSNDDQAQVEQMLALVARVEHDYETRWSTAEADAAAAALRKLRERALEQELPTRPVFLAKGLGKRFKGGDFRLQGVDLELRPGEITGVVGQNAQGKTTLLRLVAGELQPTDGWLSYPTLSDEPATDWVRVKSRIAYLPQELPAWEGSLADSLHYEAALHGILGADNEREVRFFLERLELTEHITKRWAQLSGGNKLRFSLARVLIWKPELLVLDEPLGNLDPKAQVQLLQDLWDMARSKRHPLAVLLSSQHIHEVEAVSTTLVFLRRGDVVFNGPLSTLGENRLFNTYEVGTSSPLALLKGLFAAEARGEPYFNGVSYVLKTERRLIAERVLRRMLDAGVDVTYFRDISRSAMSLFE